MPGPSSQPITVRVLLRVRLLRANSSCWGWLPYIVARLAGAHRRFIHMAISPVGGAVDIYGSACGGWLKGKQTGAIGRGDGRRLRRSVSAPDATGLIYRVATAPSSALTRRAPYRNHIVSSRDLTVAGWAARGDWRRPHRVSRALYATSDAGYILRYATIT